MVSIGQDAEFTKLMPHCDVTIPWAGVLGSSAKDTTSSKNKRTAQDSDEDEGVEGTSSRVVYKVIKRDDKGKIIEDDKDDAEYCPDADDEGKDGTDSETGEEDEDSDDSSVNDDF